MPQYFGALPVAKQSWSTPGKIQAIATRDRQVLCTCEKAQLILTILSDRLVRVQLIPAGHTPLQRSWAVARPDDDWPIIPFRLQETDSGLLIQTREIQLEVNRSNSQITAYDGNNQPFAEDIDLGMAWNQDQVAAWKRIEAEEHFYGCGERAGLLDQRSQIRTNWTTDALDYHASTNEMYQAIPFLMALRPQLAYGIFLNSTGWSQFDLGVEQPGLWQMTTRATTLDYYLIYGPTPQQILATYTQLTGRMPLPPKWALGYQQCRWSYESETAVLELAGEFRQRHLPCDVIYLDIDYMQGYRVFTWSSQRFPDPDQLLQRLQKAGFKLVAIVDPGVKYEPDGDYAVFQEGMEQDYFVRTREGQLFHGYVWPDKAVFPDFMRPDVRQWWGNWQKSLTETGVAGIWNDMNEPALDDRPFGEQGKKISFPLDALQGPLEERATHAETHNLYGLMMAKASYEGLERLRPNQRSFVLTRSGYAGIQRYSAVWTGDNQSLWEHLEMSLPMLCNLGLSGVAFVGADIGGFAGNATAELFTRWMQVGILYPLMRAHSALSSARHEPWVFGEQAEAICREYLELRYQLLPYLYSLFWQAATTGEPILRPLLYHYSDDPKTYPLQDQVMLGPFLMAAPVCRPGVEYRAVYLPEGTWYDWWSGDRYDGPVHILAHAPLERMPLYVKAGAIIPMQPVMQYVDQRSVDCLTLKIWPGEGEFTLYEDDGQSWDYRQGVWCSRSCRVAHSPDQAIVTVSGRQGAWHPSYSQITIEMVGIGQQHFIGDDKAIETSFSYPR